MDIKYLQRQMIDSTSAYGVDHGALSHFRLGILWQGITGAPAYLGKFGNSLQNAYKFTG